MIRWCLSFRKSLVHLKKFIALFLRIFDSLKVEYESIPTNIILVRAQYFVVYAFMWIYVHVWVPIYFKNFIFYIFFSFFYLIHKTVWHDKNPLIFSSFFVFVKKNFIVISSVFNLFFSFHIDSDQEKELSGFGLQCMTSSQWHQQCSLCRFYYNSMTLMARLTWIKYASFLLLVNLLILCFQVRYIFWFLDSNRNTSLINPSWSKLNLIFHKCTIFLLYLDPLNKDKKVYYPFKYNYNINNISPDLQYFSVSSLSIR